MRIALKDRFAGPIVFLTLGTMIMLAASAAAQMNGFHGGGIAPRGVPASVTSFGFGGRPGFHGVPASVTSIGFGGHPGFHGVPASVTSQGFGAQPAFHGFRDGGILTVSAHAMVFTNGRSTAGITTIISMASTAPTMADTTGTVCMPILTI